MCGRFTLNTPPEIIARAFDLPEVPDLAPRYNIAPSQMVPVIRETADHKRQVELMKWGLVPSWWKKDPGIGYKTINARAEGIADKPFFRAPFRNRRILIPTSGFYEWRHENGHKQPYFIHMKDAPVFAFAGLWDRWHTPDNQVLDTFTIITTDANTLLSHVHDRMPVMVPPEDYEIWLDPDNHNTVLLEHMLKPFEPEQMDMYPVSTAVNSPKNDDASLIEPVPDVTA